MKRTLLSLLSLSLLASCASQNEPSSYQEHSYSEVSDLTITYDQAFSVTEEDHFVYFYQETCHSCEEIRNEVIDFALNVYPHFYFVKANMATPNNYTFEEINKTLGSSNVDDVFVGVTPQLAFIKNGKIEKNIIKNIYIEEELYIFSCLHLFLPFESLYQQHQVQIQAKPMRSHKPTGTPRSFPQYARTR